MLSDHRDMGRIWASCWQPERSPGVEWQGTNYHSVFATTQIRAAIGRWAGAGLESVHID